MTRHVICGDISRDIMKKNTLVTLLLLLGTFYAAGQESKKTLVLRKKKKVVTMRKDWGEQWIGLTTRTDTIRYFGEKEYSYKIAKITGDSIYVEEPVDFHFDVRPRNLPGHSTNQISGGRYLKTFKKSKIRYDTYIVIDSMRIKGFSYQEITSIQYPPEGSSMTGCIMCVFLPIIPVANVWLYHKMRKRYHPRSYDMTEWRITTSDQIPELAILEKDSH